MTGPGDEAAAGGGGLRASRADREQAIEVLKVAFVQGRLDKDEFDARVGQAFASRTCLELAAVTADIPAWPVESGSTGKPGNRSVRSGLTVIAAGTAIAAALWAVALLTGNATAFMMAFAITVAYAGTLILAGAVMLESRQRKRDGGQLSSGWPLRQVGA